MVFVDDSMNHLERKELHPVWRVVCFQNISEQLWGSSTSYNMRLHKVTLFSLILWRPIKYLNLWLKIMNKPLGRSENYRKALEMGSQTGCFPFAIWYLDHAIPLTCSWDAPCFHRRIYAGKANVPPPAFQANPFPGELSPSNPERLWPSTTGAAHCARTRGHKSRMPRKNQCHRRRNKGAMAFSAGVGPPPRGKVAAYTSQSPPNLHAEKSRKGYVWICMTHLLQFVLLCCFPDLNALYLGVSIQSWARRVALGFKGLKGVRESQFVSYPCGWLASGQTTLKQRFHQGWFETVGNQSFPMWKFQKDNSSFSMFPWANPAVHVTYSVPAGLWNWMAPDSWSSSTRNAAANLPAQDPSRI
jgi:hypothetical protein